MKWDRIWFEREGGHWKEASVVCRLMRSVVLMWMVLTLAGCTPLTPPPTPTTPPFTECTCSQSAPAPTSSEQVIDDKQVVLPNLTCRARVIALHDTVDGESRYRAVVLQASGATCNWSAFLEADRLRGEELARNQAAQTVAGLPTNYKGDVLVWRKDGPPVIQQGLTKPEVQALLDQPQVGRVVVPSAKVIEMTKLQNCAGCYGPPYSFNIAQIAEAAEFGRYVEVGILEANVYNDKTLDLHDERVKDPVERSTLGPCKGDWFHPGCDDHANRVASQMWAKGYGYIRESGPISVGVGDQASETDLFNRYQAALEFFGRFGARVVNVSNYFSLDTEECTNAVTRDFELLQDYYQYKYGLLMIQAVGNGCGHDICIRVTNSLTIGSRRSDTSQTANIAYFNGGTLEIPNLVGGCNQGGADCEDMSPSFKAQSPYQPGCSMCCMWGGNSLNAPAATSLAVVVARLGHEFGQPLTTRPQTLRAILMASADYDEDLARFDTSTTCTGCSVGTTCLQTDCRFGAGELDGSNALRVLQTEDYNSWWVDSSQWQRISKPFSCEPPSCLVKGVAAWANAVDCDHDDCSGDGHVSHDLDLILEQRINGVWTPIMKSSSRESTTEWLQTRVRVTGPTDNQFRFVIWQVGSRAKRPTYVSFAAFFGDQLRVPTRDLTPPTAKFDVIVNGTYLHNLSYELQVAQDDFIMLIARGEDSDAGLNNTSISGDIVVGCRQGNLAQSKRFKTMVVEPTDPHVHQAGETAKTQLNAYYSFYVRDFANACDPGYTMTTISGQLGASAQNALGNIVEATQFRFTTAQP